MNEETFNDGLSFHREEVKGHVVPALILICSLQVLITVYVWRGFTQNTLSRTTHVWFRFHPVPLYMAMSATDDEA